MAQTSLRQRFLKNPLGSPDLVLNGIGLRERMKPSLVRRPIGTGDYLFMYFYGPACAATEEVFPLLTGGIFIVWTPGSGQYYGNSNEEYLHSWTHCDGIWIRELLSAAEFPLNIPLHVMNPELVDDYILAIHREAVRLRPDVIIVRNLFENWIREIKRDLEAPVESASRNDWLLSVRRYMEAEYGKKLTLADLASYGKKSIPHLCAVFKKHYQYSPVEYIIHLRLNEALHLLRDVNLSVTEIAARVGYEDLYHFSKLFKKRYGLSPLAMRRRYTRSE